MMRKLSTPSPALVVALLALGLALGGTGIAATRSGSGPGAHAAAAKKRNGTVRRGPRGPAGPRGPQGAQGTAGAQGPQGAAGANGRNGTDGTNGSPAFGAMLGRGDNVPAGTSFLAPSGELAANASENLVSSFTANAPMTASDLAVSLSVAPGLADSRTFTLRVGNADTALKCVVAGGTSTCTSTGSVTIPAASLIAIGSTSTGAPDPTDARLGWRATG